MMTIIKCFILLQQLLASIDFLLEAGENGKSVFILHGASDE